jgi:hypothetical protein
MFLMKMPKADDRETHLPGELLISATYAFISVWAHGVAID